MKRHDHLYDECNVTEADSIRSLNNRAKATRQNNIYLLQNGPNSYFRTSFSEYCQQIFKKVNLITKLTSLLHMSSTA